MTIDGSQLEVRGPIGLPSGSDRPHIETPIVRHDGHDYQNITASHELHSVETKMEEARQTWKDDVHAFFNAAFQHLQFAANHIQERLQKIPFKMKLAWAFVFGSKSDVLAIKSEASGKKLVRELLKEAENDQFGKDFDRSDYFWNGFSIDERALPDLNEVFGAEGVRNMASIFVQTITADIASNVMPELYPDTHPELDNPPVFANTSRVKYFIQDQESKVTLTISLIFSKRTYHDKSEQYIHQNFVQIDRQISMSKEDFKKNWSTTPENEIAPSLQIKDCYTLNLPVATVMKSFAKGKDDKLEIGPDHTIRVKNEKISA